MEKQTTELPIFIVGLDTNSTEGILAKNKFQRSIEALAHTEQGILEARATVKSHSLEKNNRRYEVHVFIKTSKEQHDFTENGWSIEEVFENIGEKVKRLMTKPRERRDHRRRLSRGELESVRYAE